MEYTLILHLLPDSLEKILEFLQQNYPNYNIITEESKDGTEISLDKNLPLSDKSRIFYISDTSKGISSGYHNYPHIPLIAWQHLGNSEEDLSLSPWLILDPEALYPEYLEEIYHHFYGIPLTVLTTNRCILRELCMSDLEHLIQLQNNLFHADGGFFPDLEDAETTDKNTENDTDIASQDLSEDFSANLSERLIRNPDSGLKFLQNTIYEDFLRDYIKYQYSFYGYGLYAIEQKAGQECDMRDVVLERDIKESVKTGWIGIAGFSSNELLDGHIPVSYSILPEYQRQGYAKEVITALTNYARETLEMKGCYARIREDNLPSRSCIRSCHYAQDPCDKTLFWYSETT